jgi:uncharacterized membrane protein HdeD (DUF308 family)
METEIVVNSSMRHWWVFILRGLMFLGAGIYILCSPATGFAALGFMLGLIIFVAGIAELLHVYHSPSTRSRGWHLILGVIDINGSHCRRLNHITPDSRDMVFVKGDLVI